MKLIKLVNKKYKKFKVDDEDFERVNYYKWRLSTGAIITNLMGRITTSVGRFILNVSKGLEVDHVDRNIFNNCRVNLRLATHGQNCANKRKLKNTSSIYKGVHKRAGDIWIAYIRTKGIRINLGTFTSELDAAKAYNEAALRHFGEFANLNKFELIQ